MLEIPPALDALLRSQYPNPTLARRALFAPHPYLDFRSAWDERALWVKRRLTSAQRKRKLAFERVLKLDKELFQTVEQPFFVAPGTLGTLRSPYPQISDGEYWCYVYLWGSEDAAQRWLEKPLSTLSNKSTILFLAKQESPKPLEWLINDFCKRQNPHLVAWSAHIEVIAGTYS